MENDPRLLLEQQEAAEAEAVRVAAAIQSSARQEARKLASFAEVTLAEQTKESAPGDPNTISEKERLEKRSEMEMWFEMALLGQLPRQHSLRPGQAQALAPAHLQMILMKACGVRRDVIAEQMGVTAATVTNVTRHPDAQFLLGKILSYAANEVVDINAKLDALMPQAVDALAGILKDGKEANRAKVAFGILDRRGYGRTETKKIEQTVVVTEKHAGLLSTALREAQEIEDIEYTVYETDGQAQQYRTGSVAREAPSDSRPSAPRSSDAIPASNSGSQFQLEQQERKSA